MSERIKPTISGSAETMLQSFYARAQYSKSKHNKFYDAKAVELVDKIENSLSPAELETFKLLKNGLDRSTIMLLTNRNEKQVDNAIQRLKNKIRDIIKD